MKSSISFSPHRIPQNPLAWGSCFLLFGQVAHANPQGLSVGSGTAAPSTQGTVLTVQVSDRAVLQWQSFNIAAGETTIFKQPSPTSIVWNQILDANPSKIFGGIQANGTVVLANQQGFWFGPDSVVKAANFIATTAAAPPSGFSSGGAWDISIPSPAASIINYGQIEVASGGSLFLVAEKVENHGVLTAPDGTLGLYAGKEVLISQRPDGRGLSAKVILPEGSVDNWGRLTADAGTIALHAQVVNQSGIVQANSVREVNGVIELYASDEVHLGAGSETVANGDSTGVSSGGTVTIKSDGSYTDSASAHVSVTGGKQGGRGGNLEVSADSMGGVQAALDGTAQAGYTSGRLLLDPTTIRIDNSGSGTLTGGTVHAGDPPTTLVLPTSAFQGFSDITLQAKSLIDIRSAWALPALAAGSTGNLTLESGGDITFQIGTGLSAGTGWNLNLSAGRDFSQTDSIKPGVGSIRFGNNSVSAVNGSITLNAGKDISMGIGAVRTTGGGNISATAVSGNINTGNLAQGFTFPGPGRPYQVSSTLGGFSTAAGGDVSLSAGGDITSYLPTGSDNSPDGGTGAFGSLPGNVTIQAKGNVYGHYVVAKGIGTISAGKSAGAPNQQLALSLIAGAWEVNATDIALQEVRNPQGIFNNKGRVTTLYYHQFDYAGFDPSGVNVAPTASVELNAKNGIYLVGASLPRNTGELIAPIYPPTLIMKAGAGGVTLGNPVGPASTTLTLFPAPRGQLSIDTTEGGGLVGLTSLGTTITVSDSPSQQYLNPSSFDYNQHAAVPVHLGDAVPVHINLSGNMERVSLFLPKAGQIDVGGDAKTSVIYWQNLDDKDFSYFHVAGDIINRSPYSFAILPGTEPDPDFTTALAISCPNLPVRLSYDKGSRTVVLQGQLTPEQAEQLVNFYVQDYDAFGVPLPTCSPYRGPNNNLTGSDHYLLPTSVVKELFDESKDVPTSAQLGYRVSGPGRLDVTAHNIDLGATTGIQSIGPLSNPSLAQLSIHSASVSVASQHDLSLLSSAIISKGDGKIDIYAGGDIVVGSTLILPVSGEARGIYSSGGADVTVIARKNIDVAGSRIATYDGGKLTVSSETGNIDAGTGGLSLQNVDQVKIDPITRVVTGQSDFIPGSGLLATTFSYGSQTVGDVYVSTPQGNVTASAGGIVQAPFNGTAGNHAKVKVSAGSRDPNDPNIIHLGNVDATGSGIIGGDVTIEATGEILGVVIASGDASVKTPNNIDVTLIAQGNATLSAGGAITGTVVGIGSISASGSSIEANLLSNSVNASGGTTGQSGFAEANAAGNAGTAAAATGSKEGTEKSTSLKEEDDLNKKSKSKPVLAITRPRVTVLLPTR